jgi:hypothetical protein
LTKASSSCASRLADYGWSPEFWERIITFYPYAFQSGSNAERATIRFTGTEVPFIRADWFVFALSQPPLYHEALALPAGNEKEGADAMLEQQLGVAVKNNWGTRHEQFALDLKSAACPWATA